MLRRNGFRRVLVMVAVFGLVAGLAASASAEPHWPEPREICRGVVENVLEATEGQDAVADVQSAPPAEHGTLPGGSLCGPFNVLTANPGWR